MTGFTKLFQTIVTSSIWGEDDKTRLVWVTMLALANAEGIVEASMSGLARAANVPLEDCQRAVEKLESPDADSRSTEHEGRRAQKIEGGWLLLNYAKYRGKLRDDERKQKNREKQQRYRDKKAHEAGIRSEFDSRDRRYQVPYKDGDDAKCDEIVSEKLPDPRLGMPEDLR